MRLNIGPLTIELSGVTEQEIPVNSRLFLDHKPATKEADRYYTFYFVNRLPLPSNDWQITFQRNDIVAPAVLPAFSVLSCLRNIILQ